MAPPQRAMIGPPIKVISPGEIVRAPAVNVRKPRAIDRGPRAIDRTTCANDRGRRANDLPRRANDDRTALSAGPSHAIDRDQARKGKSIEERSKCPSGHLLMCATAFATHRPSGLARSSCDARRTTRAESHRARSPRRSSRRGHLGCRGRARRRRAAFPENRPRSVYSRVDVGWAHTEKFRKTSTKRAKIIFRRRLPSTRE